MSVSQLRGSTQILAASITADRFVSSLGLATAQLTDGALFIKSDGSVPMAAALAMGTHKITGGSPPTAATDFVIKSYVDALSNGLQLHFVRLATATNVTTLSGEQTIDGVTTSASRVLLTNQTTGSQNGVWLTASGAWTRPVDWASAAVLPEGQYSIVDNEGTTFKNTKWFCTNTGGVTVDTTSATFSQDTSGTTYSAGTGLTLTGTVFSMTPGTSAQVPVTNSGATAVVNVSISGDVTLGSTGIATVNNTAGSGFLKYTNHVYNETPSGSVNSSNTSFGLANTPQNSSVALFVNGQLQEPGSGNDYTISGTTITMLYTPTTGDKLRAYYVK